MLGLTRVHQDHVKALTAQKLEQRNPVDPRRLHRDRLHPAILQPRGNGLQVARIRAELPHARGKFRVRIDETRPHVLDRHRDEVHRRVHVDPRCMPIRYR